MSSSSMWFQCHMLCVFSVFRAIFYILFAVYMFVCVCFCACVGGRRCLLVFLLVFCLSAAFSACMCVERVGCDIFFRLHIYFPLYDCYIVFARVGLESTTFYGCFV